MHQSGLFDSWLRDGSRRVSAVSGSQVDEVDIDDDDDDEAPWYRDRDILVPVFSGVAFVAGLIC